MGFARAMMRAQQEWDAMTPEQRERRLQTIEVGCLLPLADQQARPDWLARFRLRPDHEPIDMSWGGFQFFHDQGITNLASAKDWVLRWYVSSGSMETDLTGGQVFYLGTRDMCWQLSWWIETLEGRYPEDIGEQYGPNYYLRCRYGTMLYNHIFDSERACNTVAAVC